MAHTIILKYEAVTAPEKQKVDQVCRVFESQNAAADNVSYAGSYYDTNVEGWGTATTLEEFMKSNVAHPGLIAAIRKAIKDGSYTVEDVSDKDALYLEECATVLAEQGISVSIDGKVVGSEDSAD